MLILWKNILAKFNLVNISLQKQNLTLSTVKRLYDSLISSLENKNYDEIFDEALKLLHFIPTDFHISIIQTRSTRLDEPEEEKEILERLFYQPIVNALLNKTYVKLDDFIFDKSKCNEQ